MSPQDASTRSGDDPDDSLVSDNDQNEVAEEMLPTDANEWNATMEGYSPLTDLGGGQAMFVAFSSDVDNFDSHQAEGGVFFADMSAFSATQEDCESNNHDLANTEATESQQTGASSGGDFRALADDALSSLEREYAMTLQAEERSRDAVDAPVEVTGGETLDESDDSNGVDETNDVEEAPDPLPSQDTAERELPSIDADAVLRAVESIRLKAPALTTILDEGGEKQKQQELVPQKHDVIPSTPLAAFRRRTPKAIQATANLSRSATIAEALGRIGYMDSSTETLVIHVIGADPVECDSDDRVRTLFGPLVRWIGALKESPSHICIQLVGPNLPVTASSRLVDLMPASSATTYRLKSATASFHCGVYHDWMTQEMGDNEIDHWRQPSIAVAFNAGIWGYKEWRPTLEALCHSSQTTPFVFTSYTIEEADDDADVVEEVLMSSIKDYQGGEDRIHLWKPEENPFGSQVKRDTATAVPGRVYHENGAWQAWQLGGKEN